MELQHEILEGESIDHCFVCAIPVLDSVIFDAQNDRGHLFVGLNFFMKEISLAATVFEVTEDLSRDLPAGEHRRFGLVSLLNRGNIRFNRSGVGHIVVGTAIG